MGELNCIFLLAARGFILRKRNGHTILGTREMGKATEEGYRAIAVSVVQPKEGVVLVLEFRLEVVEAIFSCDWFVHVMMIS